MEITTTTINRNPRRRAAVNALAIVGFIALLALGIAFAIYSARFMPNLSSRFGGAAVSLSSIFRDGDEEPSLDVVTATSTIPFEDEVIVATTTTETPLTGTTNTPVRGQTTYTTVTTVTGPAALFGDPDLTVHITDIGYLRKDGDTDSFVSANTIPDNKNGAIKFTVTNDGTNVSGSWKFEADVPSSPARSFTSPSQKSLRPGDSIEFTLGFTRPREGENRRIRIEIDPSDSVDESNENNNEASRTIDIDD